MPKFFGKVGFAIMEETYPDVFKAVITEKEYFGDELKLSARRTISTESVNDTITPNTQISIVADAFINEHFGQIKYVVWMNQKWRVTTATVQRPRIILDLGGLYNENTNRI